MPIKVLPNGLKMLVRPNKFEQASRDARVAKSAAQIGSGLTGRVQQALRRGQAVKIKVAAELERKP